MKYYAFYKTVVPNFRVLSQIIRVMRITAFLILVTLVQVSASTYAQRITMKHKNVSLKEVFEQIKRQTSYDVVCKSEQLRHAKSLRVDFVNQTVQTVLDQILPDQNLDYVLNGNTFVIKAKAQKNRSLKINLQTKTITGTVKDSKGLLLSGVTVMEKNSEIMTSTDEEGKYAIELPIKDQTLVFRFVGYKTQELPVNGKLQIDVVLQQEDSQLSEVVVVGYGAQKKVSIVSSVSTVKGKDLRFPTRSLSNNLAGQVAGLIAIQRTGEPGYDNSEFWIRGISSFAGGKSPLVLVDGVPRSINDIEPDEIETFSILKDAAATAVYGAEGANGVVLITSKRGSDQKPVITFRTEHSQSKPTRLPEFVGSAEYLSLYNEALRNDGQSPMFTDELIANYRNGTDADLYPNTNWMDALLRPHTGNQRYTLNVRGGAEKAKYFVSGAYFSENGIFKDDPNERYKTNIGVKRFNLRSNIDLQVSKTTTVSVDLSGQYLLTNYPGTGTQAIFRQMLLTPPYIFPPMYSDGTLSTFPKERDVNMRNPYNMLMNSGYTKEWRSSIQSNIRLAQSLDFITPGLSFKGNVSYDYNGNYNFRRNYDPSRYYATGRDDDGKLIFQRTVLGSPDLSDPTQGATAQKNIYIESSFNYSRSFLAHTVGAMILYMQKENHANAQPLPARKQGIVGRVTYGYDNRYFIEGNFGYTGSETFAKGYRFGFFPAIGLGYQISNEPFYPEALKQYLNGLKLRFSTGRTGNDNTGGERFLYRPTFNMAAGGFNQGITSGGGSNGLGAGIAENRFEAPYIGWEIEDKLNYGIDASFFNNQIELTVDYFDTERSGILLQRRTVPATVGFRSAPWQNYGKVENWGVDGSLTARHKIGAVDIGARGTFTFARNKITEYDELAQPYPWMSVTGTRVSENILYLAERLYTNDDFDITANSNGIPSYKLKEGLPVPTIGGLLGPGDIKYEDLNDDGIINEFDRKRGVGHPYIPEIVYGFGLSLGYKNFYISTFFQGVSNTSINTGSAWTPFSAGVDQSNYRTFALDRWTSENPSQDVPMPRLHMNSANAANNHVGSTWWLKSGSFLRFKNFELGYNVPKEFLNKYKLGTARIYVMGNNLAVWDNIKHWDPETGNENSGLNYPLPKTFTFGLELSF
ncbi:TonB-dependent receptor [Sphingobacterium sp. JUb20]|uniref:TonB-dependent receptor n=2 Tax=unclassified Sphingobacterium TaxID=2609468 RepID=UPI001050AF92|nr:TonB-dependent receptor [Sphingobacterium sp. JUb20]TCR09238.1 TonB-linked SusC/RagA family outer membrane protein [Sphingobacterium sp. JUb20]